MTTTTRNTPRAAAAVAGLLTVAALLVLPAVPSPAQDPRQAPPRLEPSNTERTVLAMADRIAPEVAKMRGLEWKWDFNRGVHTKSQVLAMLSRNRDSEMAFRERQSALLIKLGVIPPGFNLYDETLKLYGGSVAGFYDSRFKELNLVIKPVVHPSQKTEEMMMRLSMGVTQEECVMAHELTHALDDQYYDLLNVVDQNQVSGDQMLARTALIEGSAVSVQYDYLYHRRHLRSYENTDIIGILETLPTDMPESRLPPMLVRQAMWPYTVGNRLVFAARKRDGGGWGTVNRMFDDIPASTEQVLHPEKYLDNTRDNPVFIALPEPDEMAMLLGEDEWDVLDCDVMGEFRLWCYFEDMLTKMKLENAREVAVRTAAGWDGDTMQALRRKDADGKPTGTVAIVWASTWDSATDAEEFFALMREILRFKYGEKAPEPVNLADTTNYRFFDSPDTGVALVRRGRDVTLLESVPRGILTGLVEMCFESEREAWTRPPRGTMKSEPRTDPEPQPIESPQFNGMRYRHPERPASITMPREGFLLTRETPSRVELRAPEKERRELIWWRPVVAAPDAFGKEFDAWCLERQQGYKGVAVVEKTSGLEHGGKPAWKLVFTGRDLRGLLRQHTSWVVELNGTLWTLTCTALKDAAAAADADLASVLASLRVPSSDE
ncbi:MAG: hypothetical protein AB7K09_23515 [Planctomycetota bacterium]